MVYILFTIGLIGLWLGAELVTKGGIGIARRLNWSETFIGITVLAIGTNLPEVIISLAGVVEKTTSNTDPSGLIIGNVLGSNMSNITLILGIAGLIKVLEISKKEVVSHGSAMIAASLAFWLLAQDGILSRSDGFIFLIIYFFYIIVISNNERKLAKEAKKHQPKKSGLFRRQGKPVWFYLLYLAAGLILVGLSSHFVVENGLKIAKVLEISQALVGIVMIGVGTSLPELAVSISSLKEGSAGLSVGNLIGSNIINILLALGLGATFDGWFVSRSMMYFDLPFLVVTSIVAILFLITRTKLERKESFLALALYCGYLLLKLQGF